DAQLCQGSLGDPIVNITFGAGSNPGPPLAAAAGYSYIAADCPNDGSYTVRNNSSSCFGGNWHNIAPDHTGDPNGYFMLVNAAIGAGVFYIDTIRGLCGNTTYEFAAWVMNVSIPQSCSGNSILPNLTFRIEKTDGTLLQTYNTNDIQILNSPTWKQYGFFFTTAPGIPDIVVRIFNNAPGGCGNDLAIDDITFRPCGPLLVPSIVAQPANNVTLCEGNAGTFNFTCQVSGGFTMPSYQWQQSINGGAWTDIAGETLPTLTRSFPANATLGIYAFRLAVAEAGNMGSAQCRIASTSLSVNINANPSTTALNSGPVCDGTTLILTATGGSIYQWTGPGGFSGNGSPLSVSNLQASQQGKYYVLVKDNNGCEHLDSTIVDVNPSPSATTTFNQVNICPGDSTVFSASGGISYEWQPAEGLSSAIIQSPKASPSTDTHYEVIVSNSFNCVDTAFIDVNVIAMPQADAGPDRSMLENEPITIEASIAGDNFTYNWSPSPYINNISLLQPQVNPPVDTKFILNANSGCGSSSDSMKVFVYKDIFIPGAFSPNEDGINDTWYIPALSAFNEYELIVFNRYGEKVFQLRNENRRWDGTFKNKRLPVGAYVYSLVIKKYINPYKGTVMLIR
ncbi:MAG: gliding motility-associated C-terminal domain-containing protein, partial [Ferruginibacter sp.]